MSIRRHMACAALAMMATDAMSQVSEGPVQAAPQNPDSFFEVPILSRNLPAELAEIQVPEEFVLQSSVVYTGSGRLQVSFETRLPVRQARDLLLSALEARGWEREANPAMREVIVLGGSRRFTQICRQGLRRTIRVDDMGTWRRATYSSAGNPPQEREGPLPCNSPDLQTLMRAPGPERGDLLADSPTLELPESARLAPGQMVTSMGSGRDSLTHTARIIATERLEELVQQLDLQLVHQGWSRDATWSGKFSAGSTWKRSRVNGETVWGILEAMEISQEMREIRFGLLVRPEGVDNSGFSFAGSSSVIRF